MKKGISKTSFLGLLPYVVIIIIGVGVSSLLFFTIRLREKAAFDHAFRQIAQNRVSALERLIHYKFGILESVRCFFESSQLVEPEEFESFVSSFSDFEGFYSIAWIPCVKDDQRRQFEAQAEAAGMKGFFIKEMNEQGDWVPARKREEYFPVYYVSPPMEKHAALGFDNGSDPVRYRAIGDARDRNAAIVTERVQLVQDDRKINSVIVFIPLYKKGMPAGTVQQRRENLEGFVAAAFHTNVLVERALRFTDVQDIHICLLDKSASADKQYLCCYPPCESEPSGMAEAFTNGRLHTESTIEPGMRKWSVICAPGEGMLYSYMTFASWTALAIGLFLTLSAILYYRSAQKKTEAVQRLVGLRTQELAKLTKQLKAKNAELQNVVYIASHDLKSPLVTISGFCNELQEGCDKLRSLYAKELSDETMSAVGSLFETSISESLTYIHAGVKKTQMLIDGLLQVSRAGTSPFRIERIDMNEMIKNVIENHSFQARECRAEISVDVLPDCFGDGPKTNQVFSNLITNALKYLSPKRPGRIHISATIAEDRSIYCVADNGIGVPSEHQSRVFEVFHRVKSDASVNVSGDGLGLAIVSRILEGQNGEIWLESDVNQGSKFYVSLPTA